jgi:hypothetical protein
VRAGAITIIREGCGSGEAKALTPGEAHELALKAAETAATKRVLATFGNPFGLALYDRELAGVRNRKALDSSASKEHREPLAAAYKQRQFRTELRQPEEFARALKTALTEAFDIERLFAVWEQTSIQCAF